MDGSSKIIVIIDSDQRSNHVLKRQLYFIGFKGIIKEFTDMSESLDYIMAHVPHVIMVSLCETKELNPDILNVFSDDKIKKNTKTVVLWERDEISVKRLSLQFPFSFHCRKPLQWHDAMKIIQ